MHKLKVFSSLILIATAGHVAAGAHLSIADAEAAGFEKRGQQMFQMIGATDGWSGSWAGDKVELYEYKSSESVNPKVFESSVQEGNISGWVELCQHENMLMLSKGKKACAQLNKL